MSQSVSLAAFPRNGRGNTPQQEPQHSLLQQRQPQRDGIGSATNIAEGDGEAAQNRHQRQQQDPQQRQRSRRPRSIHITLRKTRAGSRPVNIQRGQNHFFNGAGERVSSPTGTWNSLNSSSRGVRNGVDAYQVVGDGTLPRSSPADQHRDPNLVSTRRNGPPATTNSSNTNNKYTDNGFGFAVPLMEARISPYHMPDTASPHGRSRAGSNTDIASGQYGRVASNSGGGGGASGSPSSSFNNIGGSAGVGPSSGGSGSTPSSLLQCVPQLNAFMRAPHAALQQLLPPGMRDRVSNSNNTSSSNTDPNSAGGVKKNRNDDDGGGGGGGNPLRSRSLLYVSSPNMTHATNAAPIGVSSRLRSSSLAGQHDGLTGSYSGVLGDFVFPYPDRSASQQQLPTTPPVVATANPINAPTGSFDARSRRLSPPTGEDAGGNVGAAQQQQQQHRPRSRSYTAGGRMYSHNNSNYHHRRRSSNGPVITASMAGAGGAALFGGGHLASSTTTHAERRSSHNLDRSLSVSAGPAAFGGWGGGTALDAAATTNVVTLAYPPMSTSRSSLRSGATREATPVSTTASATPPAQQQQQQQQQRPMLSPSAVGTPAPLGRSTRKSGSFPVHRSGSSDVVNGLDDSADSVLYGSTPRRRSANVPPGVGGGTHRYLTDSTASDSGTPNAADGGGGYRPRRYSMPQTDEDEGTHTAAPPPQQQQQPLSTVDRLRSRRDGGGNGNSSGIGVATRPTPTNAAEPKTAIERWRAQEEQKRRVEVVQSRRHRLSARQWREAFHRLAENRMRWTVRSFIGAGTSGKVYEGVLDDAAHTPVAVKVLDVGVPMPAGPDVAGAASEDSNMSPAQQEAVLVLLREIEMMEKLHQRNIVTCLRCQVTPVQDRFMELHHKQQQPPPGSRMQQTDGAGLGVVSGVSSNAHAPPGDNFAVAAATRIPVQVEIIMELCTRGTLARVVRRSPGGQLPVVTARRYLRDVLKGLAYLHRNNFIHRDVKGENVLISADDVAKLADFGCSSRIVMTNSHVPGEGHDGTMSSIATTHATDSRCTTMVDYQWCEATGVAHTMVGTPMFMAPEIIQASGAQPASPCSVDSTERRGDSENNIKSCNGSFAAATKPVGYTASADIWSFGCLVLEVFGRTPWPTAGNNAYHLMKQIEQSVDDVPPGVPPDTPPELLSVLRCCFHRDPNRRSTARMLLRSPWMTCADAELEEMPPRKRR
ncbi:serine/threonine protein kinase-like protein [Leptomonas pyrrhocoris]|uniref:Serine/threonine protein kinase-like protein n=1 Tax=Leptomonas pyrrhocoris TaxID=157538 RepID=A0A0M9FT59_LEPPY|nr:serine/threonine protein kinase-like protein [Leptomonas pyrrhocoris]KPA75513.1 serine/threonine protein kinase-like protein [Leptomonas pyrrhocoris]|eukprot:XP_015653952.1 serine/threonine protein kinase-like protein [Leptomonas pyrrhocoris]